MPTMIAETVVYDDRLAQQYRDVIAGKYNATPIQVTRAANLLAAMERVKPGFGHGLLPESETVPVPAGPPEPAESLDALKSRLTAGKAEPTGIGFDFVKAGKATFTVVIPREHAKARGCQERYTFRVTRKDTEPRRTERGSSTTPPAIYFVGLLSGPNNDADYSYLGVFEPVLADIGKAIRITKASVCKEDSPVVKLFNYICRQLARGNPLADGYAVMHSGTCGRCGATLTTPRSLLTGLGPECIKHV
jgi:hypothetical protein